MLNTRNNFILAPIKLGYCNAKDGRVNHRHIEFYDIRSKDVGLVTYEPLYLSKSIRELPTQLGIDSDDKINCLSSLNSIVHNNGAKAIAHLNHPGRMANPKLPGNMLMSSTEKMCEAIGIAPKKMDKEDIQNVIKLFVEAAKRAEKADFDAIELQFGHGYLVSQFLSPKINDRNDEYGGNFENRSRFAIEILDSVRKNISLPIFIRMTASEMLQGGIDISEAIEFAKILKTKKIEAVHIVTGSVCDSKPWFFQHMFTPKGKIWELAKTIKKEANTPVVAVGRINSKKDVDYIKNEIKSDYIALGRPFVADPEFLSKYLGKSKGNIRPCLACSEACIAGVKSGEGLQCVVNPEAGRNGLKILPAKIKKNIAIIGGGLAGMEAALRLKNKGHKVTIFEKDKLGGQFNLAWLPPKKDSLKEIIEYYKNEIHDKKINVQFNEVSSTNLIDKGFDEVIIATGSKPIIPKIKGINNYYWAEILLDEKPKNEKILIIGGGLIGIEIASKLIENNNEVIIVELLDEIGREMETFEKKLTMKNLQEKKVSVYLKHKVTEVKDNGKTVVIEGEEKQEIKDIDKIVASIGMQSENKLKDELEGKIKYHIIGDAAKPAKAKNAIHDGYDIAVNI
jgi:2,4-dienoyl-CoA reductase (NADPH2)